MQFNLFNFGNMVSFPVGKSVSNPKDHYLEWSMGFDTVLASTGLTTFAKLKNVWKCRFKFFNILIQKSIDELAKLDQTGKVSPARRTTLGITRLCNLKVQIMAKFCFGVVSKCAPTNLPSEWR